MATDYQIGQKILNASGARDHPRIQELISTHGEDEAAVKLGELWWAKNPRYKEKFYTAPADALRTDKAEFPEKDDSGPFRLDPIFPYDPEKESSWSPISTMLGIPPEISSKLPALSGTIGNLLTTSPINAGLATIEAVRDLPEVLEGLGTISLGLASKMSPSPGGYSMYPPGEEALESLATEAGGFISDPEAIARYIQEEPFDAASMTFGPFRPALSGLPVAQKAAAMLNPARVPRGLAGGREALREAGWPTGPTAPLSATTGASGEALGEAWESGKEGGERSRLFRKGIRTTTHLDRGINLLREFEYSFNMLYKKRSQEYRAGLKNLRVAGDLDADLTNLRVTMREELKDMGIEFVESGSFHPINYKGFDTGGSPQRFPYPPPQSPKVNGQIKKLDFKRSTISYKGDQEAIRSAVNAIETWDHTSVMGMHQLKKRLWDLVPPGEADIGQRFGNRMYHDLRLSLENSVTGYKKLTTDYKKLSELIEQIDKTLSMPSGHKDAGKSFAVTINKIDQLMDDNRDYGRYLIAAMHEYTGKNFIPTLSGMALRDVLPTSLVGRSGFARGIRSAVAATGIAGAASTVSPLFLLSIPFFSPKLVGEILHVTGRAYGFPRRATRAMGNRVQNVLKDIEKKYPSIANSSYSIKQVLSAVDTEDAILYNRMLHEALNIGEEPEPQSVFPLMETAAQSAAKTVGRGVESGIETLKARAASPWPPFTHEDAAVDSTVNQSP
jgi:hypothetical protein